MKQPAILFYVGDWRKDMAIQSLSYYHRGVWFELLLLMHCSEQRGRLTVNCRPMSNASLARLLGLTEGEAKDAIDVLIANGVASRDATGTLVNRRMVREEERRDKLRDNGSKGGSKAQANRQATLEDVNEDEGLEEVRGFSRGEGIPLPDADWFFYKCRGNGWTNGGKPIRDWKATLRSWKRAGYLPSQRNGKAGALSRLKEKAPTYPKLPESREPSDEEIAHARQVVHEHVEALKEHFKVP